MRGLELSMASSEICVQTPVKRSPWEIFGLLLVYPLGCVEV